MLPAPLPVPSTPPPSPTPSPSAPPASTPAPSPSETAAPLRLWFVLDDGLAAVESDLPEGSPPGDVLLALAVGPAEGPLRTIASDPLTGAPLVSVAPAVTATEPTAVPSVFGPPESSPATEPVVVRLTNAFSALPPSEQVLLLGQVVLSLTGAGERAVAFTDEAGNPLAVPLPDGRLLDVPATARDYGSLIVQP